MESFSECFGYLLTFCRENALRELRTNKTYIRLNNEQEDLLVRLEAAVNPESQGVLAKFLEAAVAVKSMECNRALLCGLTVSTEIRKRFDASTDEYKAFEAEYL